MSMSDLDSTESTKSGYTDTTDVTEPLKRGFGPAANIVVIEELRLFIDWQGKTARERAMQEKTLNQGLTFEI